MDAKLTLKLDKNVVEKAEIYAAEQKTSLSFIVKNYLKAITSNEKNETIEEIKYQILLKVFPLAMENFQPILITKKRFRKYYQKNMNKLLTTLCFLISKTPKFQ